MRFEVTLCYSLIEFCLQHANLWQRGNDATEVLNEIRRRKVVLNDELVERWERYFTEQKPELLGVYTNFYIDLIQYRDECKFLDSYETCPVIDQLFVVEDVYKRLLYNICFTSRDKILLTNIMDDLIQSPHSEIDIYNVRRILDHTEEHRLNNYRLPVVRKSITYKSCSHALSNWLRPFFEGEREIVIGDNYLCQNHESLYRYILCHVEPGATIKVYTFIPVDSSSRRPTMTEDDLKRLFNSPPFDQWNFEIYLFTGSRRAHHTREIVTSKYLIALDKGLATFGRAGETDQSDVTVKYLDSSFQMPPGRKIN